MAQSNKTFTPVYLVDNKRWDGKTLVLSVREQDDDNYTPNGFCERPDSSRKAELRCRVDRLIALTTRENALELVRGIDKAIEGRHLVSFSAWGNWSSRKWFEGMCDFTAEYEKSERLHDEEMEANKEKELYLAYKERYAH